MSPPLQQSDSVGTWKSHPLANMILLVAGLGIAATASMPLLLFSLPEILVVIGVIALAVCCVRWPMTGVYLIILLHALGAFSFTLQLSGHPETLFFRPFDLLVFVLAPSLISQVARRDMQRFPAAWSWMRFFTACLLIWSLVCILAAPDSPVHTIGWWKLASNAFMVAYLISTINSHPRLLQTLLAYCILGALFALATFATTFFATKLEWTLAQSESFLIKLIFMLFNSSGNFYSYLVGLKSGVGLAGKHEVAQVLVGAQLFAVALWLASKQIQRGKKFFLALVILLAETAKYQLFSKTAMLGSLLIILFFILVIHHYRKHAFTIAACILALNILGAQLAHSIRPNHMKRMESLATSFQRQLQSTSSYEPGSMSYRINTWKKTLRVVKNNPVFGVGPDSLFHDVTFGDPHGHNLFLTTAAEYGLIGFFFMACLLLAVCVGIYSFLTDSLAKSRLEIVVPLSCLAASVAFGFFDYSIDNFIYWPDLWFKIGLTLAAGQVLLSSERPSHSLTAPIKSSPA